MPLSPDDKLGPYEILAPIGKGGMGEVWKAHDPRVGRDVPIKVSAAQFSERFEREAKAIAALNHPNILMPAFVTRIFEGFRSRCVMPLLCAASSASQICTAYFSA
jgi:serine/threonine protein kinase